MAFGHGAAGGVAGDHLPGLAQVALLVVVLQTGADADDLVGDFLAPAVDRGEQQLQQPFAQPRRHVRDHAQVEDRQLPLWRDAEVARVRVGMDFAMHEDLVQIAAHQRLGQRLHRLLGTAHRRNGVHPYAVHQLHGQHPAAAQIPQRLRHDQFGIGRQMLAEAGEVAGFGLEIQFHAQAFGELAEPVGKAHLAADPGEVVGGTGEAAQHRQVRAQLRGDIGFLHLHRHLAAIVQAGTVHLGDRAAAQRFGVEPGEQLVHRNPEILFDDGANLRHRDRRDVLLHAFQRRHVLRRNHVRPRGQHLAKLDEGDAQRFQVGDELGGIVIGGDAFQARQLAVELDTREHARVPVAQQQAHDLLAPVHAADGGCRGISVWLVQEGASAIIQRQCYQPPVGGK